MSDMHSGDIERLPYDVVVIGAGGSGLRAAIEARLAGQADRDHLQVAVRQGAHGHGRGRLRRGHGQRQPERQLDGALPRHHARREVPEQPADGRAARQGGAGPGLGAGGLGRGVRPHQGRQDQPAELRRPRVPAARARRRPHRPGDDPHAAAEGRRAAAGGRRRAWRPGGDDQGLRRDHDHPADQGRRGPDGRRVRLHPGDRPVRGVRGARGHPGHRRHRQDLQGQLQLLGVHRRRARARAAGRGQAAEHGVRPVPPDAHGLADLGARPAGDRVGPR